jgi:hypothetical protein
VDKIQIEKLFDIIDDIVREDTSRWTEKRDMIRNFIKEHDQYEGSFWEFIAWFETGEEDQPETTGED